MATALQYFNESSLDAPTRVIAVWCGDDELQVQSAGLPVLVPPVGTVADAKAKGSKYRFSSAIDPETGKPLPGTVLLETQLEPDPEAGTYKIVFDAVEWAKLLRGNNPKLLERGFDIVTDPRQVKAKQAAGRPKWEKAKKLEWQNVIAEETRRRKKLEERGEPYTDSSSAEAVREAVEGLTRLGSAELQAAIPTDILHKLIGVNQVKRQATPEPIAAPAVSEADLVAKYAETLFSAAEAGEVNLTKAQLSGLMKRDEAVMKEVADKLEAAGINV